MTTANGAFPIPATVIRPRSRPAPLAVWGVALLLFLIGAAAAAVSFVFATPLPADFDLAGYRKQLASLEQQEAAYRAGGAHPLSIVFVGTSRIKNVVVDPQEVARAAKSAGVDRPIASSFMAINWGGFERIQPAIDLLLDHRPNVVVLMPELFVEDFSRARRVKLGFRFLQSKLWGNNYSLFSTREFSQPICKGFEQTVEDRLAAHRDWIREGGNLPGPKMARNAVRDLTDRGVLVVIADVPVSRSMIAQRPAVSGSQFTSQSGLAPSGLIRTAWIGQPFDDSVYCDWAHIDPRRGEVWRHAFFSRVAEDLNALP